MQIAYYFRAQPSPHKPDVCYLLAPRGRRLGSRQRHQSVVIGDLEPCHRRPGSLNVPCLCGRAALAALLLVPLATMPAANSQSAAPTDFRPGEVWLELVAESLALAGRGAGLKPVPGDPAQNLRPLKERERPKVVFNPVWRPNAVARGGPPPTARTAKTGHLSGELATACPNWRF